MWKAAKLLKEGKKAWQDLEMLKCLQSEIRHELANDTYKKKRGSVGDFVIKTDSPHSEDVIFRKESESGEEILVSTLLFEETFVKDSLYPKEASMMVGIKKDGFWPYMLFDCNILDEGQSKIGIRILRVFLLKTTLSRAMDSKVYYPAFSKLNPALQQELKQYLISKGISNDFTTFLMRHIHHKEKVNYMKWLRKMEARVTSS